MSVLSSKIFRIKHHDDNYHEIVIILAYNTPEDAPTAEEKRRGSLTKKFYHLRKILNLIK